jgi:hypothetical protein
MGPEWVTMSPPEFVAFEIEERRKSLENFRRKREGGK